MKYFNRKIIDIIFFLILLITGGMPAQEVNLFGEMTDQFEISKTEKLRDTMYISLSQALEEALANNYLLKKAGERTKAGYAAFDQTKGAMLPKVDANFSYAYLDIVPGFRSLLLGNIQHDLFPNIAVSQPIYAGGKLKYSKEAAKAQVESLEQAFLAQLLDVKLSVYVNYFQLQSLISQREILKDNLEQLRVQHQLSRLLVNAGRMSQLEVERIDVAIITTRGNLLRIENDYQTVSNNISLLLGREAPQTMMPADSLQIMPFNENYDDMIAITLDNNPTWQQLEWDLRKAEQLVKVQEAARLPQVSASAYYGYEFGLESFSLDDNKRYYAGLTASVPIYHGKVIQNKISEAQSGVEQIRWQQEYLRKSFSTLLQNKYATLKEREQQIMIRKRAFDQAQKSYRLALIEYNAGKRSNTDLLDIQKAMLESRLMMDQAILDYNNAGAWLRAIMGIL